MTIETSEQYQAAIARLCEIGDAPATGADQNEYLDISAAMVEYETRTIPRFGRGSNVIVRCPDDYERAVERIAELGNPLEGSVEEAELDALIDATDEWDARHEDDDWQ